MPDQKPTVATPTAAVERMRPDWCLAAALLGGTRAMREAGKEYLRKWAKEDDQAYADRLATAVLFPAYSRTVHTLAAKPFSKPIHLEDDIPPEFKPWLDDIDMEGRNLDAFAADVFECAMGYGLCGILVDFPEASGVVSTEAGVRTQADEQKAGLRPYWVHIKPHQILGWRAARVAGEWVIQQLRLMECVEEQDGDWGTKTVEQVRVLEPGKWSVYRKVKREGGAEEWVIGTDANGRPMSGTTTLDIVPFAPVYGKRTNFMVGVPPLIEVAHLNVSHWQSASDQQTLLHVARVPILTAVNVQDATGQNGEPKPWELTIGASAAVRINGENADLKYVEHSGKALEAGAKDLETLEDRMRQAGAELLVIGPGANTRIEAAAANDVGMCALQRITLAFEDALDLALSYTAKWVNQPTGGGSVELFRDFAVASLAEASAELLLKANQAGKLSDETFFEELQRRAIIGPDADWGEEKERLQEQGPPLGMIPPPAPGPAPQPSPAPPPDPEELDQGAS